SVFSSVLGPTAGEDQRSQPSQGGFTSGALSSASREMPALDRSSPFSQLSAQSQAQSRESSTPSGWNLSPASSGSTGDWPSSFGRSKVDESLDRPRPNYRPLGPLSDAQRGRPTFQPEEFANDEPPRRPASRAGEESGFGMAA